MNTLLQDESLLIGSREEIQKLATKDSARILVVSDSHGAYSNLLLILRQFGVASDALVFCGDGICDISKLISNAVDEAEIKAIIPPVIGIVEGNNDADLYPVRNVLSDEPYYVQWKVPIFNVLEACGQRIFCFSFSRAVSTPLGSRCSWLPSIYMIAASPALPCFFGRLRPNISPSPFSSSS